MNYKMTKIKNINYSAIDVVIAFAIMGIVVFGLALIMPLITFVPSQQKDNYGLFLMLSAGIIYLTKKYKISIEEYGFNKHGITKTIMWGVGGGIFLSILNFPLRTITRGTAWIDFEIFLESNSDRFSVISFLVFASLLLPIMEEILFRGYVYRVLKNRYKVFLATVITCAAYAVGHLDIVFALYSYVLISVNEKSNFLGSSIIAHVLWNSSWYLSIYFFKVVPVHG